MTLFPKYLTSYPNMDSAFPFHLTVNKLNSGYIAHRHDFLECSFVISGFGSETVNGVTHPMEPGTFTFVLPYQIHEIHTTGTAPLQLFNCMFGMNLLFDSFLEPIMGAFLAERDDRLPAYAHATGERHARMLAIFREMLDEYGGDGTWKIALLKAKLVEALVLFDRIRTDEAAASGAGNWKPAGTSGEKPMPAAARTGANVTEEARNGRKSPGSRSGGIWQVIHYVHSHYQEPMTLSALAERFHFSVSHLSELFKKTVGQTFVQFLHEVRIRHACGLLASTGLNVSDVALEAGFGSYKTFARIFREHRRETPAEYRNRKRLPESGRGDTGARE